MSYRRISVITPSFNQGGYIEQTILSVLGQNYPNLEYFIIDGGSTDETVDIIKKYENHITRWVSESDNGQSHAINKGFEMATGEILCWLNSDDFYLPGVLFKVNEALNIDKAMLLYGNVIHLNEEKNFVYRSVFDPLKQWDIKHGDFIVQPGSFWTRRAFELTGKLNEQLHYGFDWEWYARARQSDVQFIPSAAYYAIYRLHSQQKSDDNNDTRFKELITIERTLNPQKFSSIDQYVDQHLASISNIFKLTTISLITPLEYRLLKLLHPRLMAQIDRVTLKKYLKHYKSIQTLEYPVA